MVGTNKQKKISKRRNESQKKVHSHWEPAPDGFACARLLIIFGCWPHEMRKRKKPLSDSFFISFIIKVNDVHRRAAEGCWGWRRTQKKGSRHFNRKISVISVTWLACPPFVLRCPDSVHYPMNDIIRSTLLIPFFLLLLLCSDPYSFIIVLEWCSSCAS